MKIIKGIAFALVLIVIAATGFAYTQEPAWEISETVEISAASSDVFPYINTLSQWPEWTVWNQQTFPEMKMMHEGAEQGVGAIQKWQDGKMEGVIEITESVPDQSMKYDLTMDSGTYRMKGEFYLQPDQQSTSVTWKLNGNSGENIIGKLMTAIYKPMIRSDLADGLHNLKSKLENS